MEEGQIRWLRFVSCPMLAHGKHPFVLVAVKQGIPLAKQTKIDLKDLEPMFFVGMSEKTYQVPTSG